MSTLLHFFRNRPGHFVVVCASIMLITIMLLPLLEMVSRPVFGRGVSGSINYVRHATLWFGFLGAVLAARAKRHISLGVSSFLTYRGKNMADVVANTLAIAICLILANAALDMVIAERSSEVRLGGIIPLWLAQSVMPASLVVIAYSYFRQLREHIKGKKLAALLLSLSVLACFVDIDSGYFLPLGIGAILVSHDFFKKFTNKDYDTALRVGEYTFEGIPLFVPKHQTLKEDIILFLPKGYDYNES